MRRLVLLPALAFVLACNDTGPTSPAPDASSIAPGSSTLTFSETSYQQFLFFVDGGAIVGNIGIGKPDIWCHYGPLTTTDGTYVITPSGNWRISCNFAGLTDSGPGVVMNRDWTCGLCVPPFGCETSTESLWVRTRTRGHSYCIFNGWKREDAALLVADAIDNFQAAYSGAGRREGYAVVSALLTDELYHSGRFASRTATDQRAQLPPGDGNTSEAAYSDLHEARGAAIRAFRALVAVGDGNTADASLMKLYEGFTYLALGEGYCSGIPFSEVAPDGTLIHGVPISTQQVFEEAIPRFDAALSIDGSNLAAAVGKGRALMNLGRFAEAAAAVASVPTTYNKSILYSGSSRHEANPIWDYQDKDLYGFGLSPIEAWEDVGDGPRASRDPRMPFLDAGPGIDRAICGSAYRTCRMYLFLPHSELRSSPVTLADGIEARLIEAEANLAAGGSVWLGILNSLRADVDNLMAGKYPNYSSILQMATDAGNVVPVSVLTDPGSAAARVDLLFDERRAWMATTGHRLGDLRRLIRQYGRVPADEFPVGPYFKGGNYRTDVVLALNEHDNPNWNPNMCWYSTP